MKNIMWLNVLVGIWLIIAPFALAGAVGSHVWTANDVVLGVLLIAFAGWTLAAIAPPVGTAWFQMLCGLWLLVAPFVLQYSRRGPAVGSDLISGAVAIVVAAIGSRALTHRPTAA